MPAARLSAPARAWFLARVAGTLVRHPSLVTQLPQWLREASDRLDPLAARQPWWNFQARQFMDSRVSPGSRVFEWGGGASTLWLMDRGCQVRTIEHDRGWYEPLSQHVSDAVDLQLRETDGQDLAAYIGAIDEEADDSLDLVIVDGLYGRTSCVLAARAKVKPGGMLMLDDTEQAQFGGMAASFQGWEAHQLHGLKTGGARLEQSTVWIKPGAQ
jgi:hypothetical protein